MKDFNFKKNGDKLLFVLAIVVFTFLLFRPLDKIAARAAAVTIVFTQWWQEDLEKDTLQELIKEYENLHENIKVVLSERSYDDLRIDLFNTGKFDKTKGNSGDQKPETAGPEVRGSPLADVFALDQLWVPDLLEKGTIEKQPAPLLSYVNVLYYNIDILKKAGFTRPPKTRNEFLTYARALNPDNAADKTVNKVYALTMGINSPRGIYDDVFPWIWSAGTQLIKDGKPSVTSRQVVENLSFLASLNSDGFIVPGVFSAGITTKLEDFISGRAAFMIAPARNIALVRGRMGDGAFGVTSVPVSENYTGKPYFAAETWTTGVYSGSAHKEEARLFAAFLTSKASILSDKAKAFPGTDLSPPAPILPDESEHSKGVRRESPPDPFYSKILDIAITGEIAQDFDGLPWTELQEIFSEELSVLFEGKSSPAETATAIQRKWETTLNNFIPNQ